MAKMGPHVLRVWCSHPGHGDPTTAFVGALSSERSFLALSLACSAFDMKQRPLVRKWSSWHFHPFTQGRKERSVLVEHGDRATHTRG